MSDTRRQLLRAARELFLAQGFANTTIQQLADSVGISKGAVYLSFRSKADLLVALLYDLEDSVLEAVSAIARSPDLTPLEKLRAQLHYQFTDVREKRRLFEVYLKESDISIDEELTLLAQKMRVDWLRVQEDYVRLAFPEHDPRFTTDLAVTLNGALNEYYTYVVLEGAEVDPDLVADYLVAMAEAMVGRLERGDLAPVLRNEELPGSEELEASMRRVVEKRIERALGEIAENARTLDSEAASEVEETLVALREVLAQESPNRVVLQGLLANLREFKEIAPQRRALAHELGLKLV